MNFLAPAAFAFAATIPVVIVFYLLKRKRVVRLVPSTLLWRKFLAETQASAPFQRLRHNWLLILQILLLLLAVFALSRPFFAANMKPAELRVVILDGSASMQATDVQPSRFERARAEALKWVDALSGQDQMVIILAAGSTEVKQSASGEKAALRRALMNCSPSDSPTRLVPALRMAESLVRDQLNAEIHLFSDGAVSGLDDFENKGLPLIYHRVGTGANNVGLTALDVRANPEDPRQRAIYVSAVNFSTNAQSAELELHFDGRVRETRPLSISAGQVSPQVFFFAQDQDGIYTLRLNIKDDLQADNEASIVSALPQPAKVLLVSRGNRLLEKALRSAGNVELTTVPDLTDNAEGYTFVVLDCVVPTMWPKRNVLAIQTNPTNWFERVLELEAPQIVDWRSTHPLLRFSGLDNVRIVRSRAAKVPSWGISLVDAPQASLVVAGEMGRQRVVWIGFDVLESEWPRRITFPIFIANAVEWLNPANVQGGQLMVKAGEPFRMSLVEPVSSAQVTYPNGTSKTVKLEAGATELILGELQRRGIYRLNLGTNQVPFCVNLLDVAESDITPRGEIQLGKYSKVTATTVQRANMEIWRTFAALAILLLLGEWWYYHRRTV